MEETFVNKNAISSLVLGYARGAVMSLIGKHQLPFHEFKPNTVKKTIVGVGHADKAQVQHMVKLLIKGAVSAKNFDESDALAIAFTCGQYRYTRLI
jgi:crossover junction endodeoxyribonuclease RuvC